MRPRIISEDTPPQVFQFTHPVRGATRSFALSVVFADVSIHAPREGCDPRPARPPSSLLKFQFTHPVRGATNTSSSLRPDGRFQFTHPVRGATVVLTSSATGQLKFQFTHPVRGATQLAACVSRRCSKFQFTHPVRGATSSEEEAPSHLEFQFTHPVRGATANRQNERIMQQQFQFTHPVRGATALALCLARSSEVSIHAPREGCDLPGLVSRCKWRAVSIHAPREGCDSMFTATLGAILSFNSRTP